MKIDLKKKNILVTGSSRGIGAAISKELGKSGARIMELDDEPDCANKLC